MNGAKLLIINSLQGAGGHRLGRILSCFEDVYWYSHPNNGLEPWSLALNNKIKESAISKYHYDRILSNGESIPLIGSRIEKYWDSPKWYDNWLSIMNTLDLPDKFLTFVVHDSPKYLRSFFPEAFIVNLICDPDKSTDRHMNTSAKFRIDFKLKGQRPDYKSVWVKASEQLLSKNKNATEADLWEYMYKTDHYQGMKIKNREANKLNFKEKSYANITLDYESLKLYDLEKYFGVLDASHKRLLHQ